MKFFRIILILSLFALIWKHAGAQLTHFASQVDTVGRPRDTSSTLIYIASIFIYGNKKTKPFIIEREIPFRQGDYLSLADLEKKVVQAKQQLVNTSLFLDVSVYIENKFGELVFITRER